MTDKTPNHYKLGGFEPLDIIKTLGYSEGFCKGNIIKYLLRFPYKNGVEDLKKARHYIEIMPSVICYENMNKHWDKNEKEIRRIIELLEVSDYIKILILELIENVFFNWNNQEECLLIIDLIIAEYSGGKNES